MERITDWNTLWRELVENKELSRKRNSETEPKTDVWANRAHKFKEGVKRRWSQPDSSREFIISQLNPNSTVLDIGAGTGDWTILLSRHAKSVTAIEPSESMLDVMRESLISEKINNVSIIKGSWPDIIVEPHDFSLCSHAMYGARDLASFIRQMVLITRRICFLLLRAPSLDGLRAEAALHIWGQPMDSPNFTIAYNILIQMGIHANVLMENTGLWKPHINSSIEEALNDMKHYLGLDDTGKHDDYFIELLNRRLTFKNGKYIWPPEVRSALVYWQIGT